MVERRDDPHDRRIWRLHLCPPAKPVLHDLHAERADMLRMVSAGLDRKMLAVLEEGLCRMKVNVIADVRSKTLERDVA
jgi:DNA-binding MarR family transcriptional regulator